MKEIGLKNKNLFRGFTLVELMVAVAIFSIVMVTATSALFNVINANNKARAIKTSINNISFALEGISKDMRMGTEYACSNSPAEPNGDCLNGGDFIKYRSIRADKDIATGKYKYVYYKFGNNQIFECLQKDSKLCNSDSDFSPITSKEVTLTKVVFYVLGVNNSFSLGADRSQPRMIMTISGEAGAKESIKTTFDLQTSISQRTRIKLP